MDSPDLHDRRRAAVAAILDAHGNASVATLRRVYGDDFAPGFGDESVLGRIVLLLDEPSLERLVDDHDKNLLADRIANA